jgi:TetR/AcrR family transcriptional regulator, lmrAB and yxaGH operons repressor
MTETTTRQRMIETAVRLFQRDGYHGTSWRTLVDEAGTPWGSIHHHFPGGKEQLGVAAVEAGSDAVASLIDHCFEVADTAADAVTSWFALSGDLMVARDFTSACPVASVAMETVPQSNALGAASRRALERWEAVVAGGLAAGGISSPRSRELARLLIVIFEGALISARLHGTREPIALAAAHAAELVRSAGR